MVVKLHKKLRKNIINHVLCEASSENDCSFNLTGNNSPINITTEHPINIVDKPKFATKPILMNTITSNAESIMERSDNVVARLPEGI